MTDENRTTMRVILCRPGEIAEVIEMEDSLKAMQETVGGLIEEYMPWEDEVAIICKRNKMKRLISGESVKDALTAGLIRAIISLENKSAANG